MKADWWRHAVIYQIYPRSFHDASGDGIGDLQGILEKLDYVASLNVDAVWISPFYPSPMADYGYDVSDYCGVDPMFGSLDDFKAVLDKAHALGMKVLIDQVWCHTSDAHPWFQLSRSSRDNDKADWYVWHDGDKNGQPPNNWLSIFGGLAWEWSAQRQQYYLHHFLKEQPALNWYNPDVQAAMLDVGRFWMDMGVDGFRFDVVNFLMHDRQLRDNRKRPEGMPLPAGGSAAVPFFHFISDYNIGQPETYEMVRSIRGMLDEYPESTSLAEISAAEDALADAAKAVAADKLHMAYNSSLMTDEPLSAKHLCEVIKEAAPLLARGGLCWTAGTHDFPRLASRWLNTLSQNTTFDQEAFNYMLAVLMVTLPGSCCLYQGDELGLPEAELAFEDLRDPFGINNYPNIAGRDGCRTPMPWHAASNHHGFTKADKPWLPAAQTHKELAVDIQDGKKHSLLNKYRRLLAWRKTQPALKTSLGIEVLKADDAVFGFIRGQDTSAPLLILLNMSDKTVHQPREILPQCHQLTDFHASGVRQFDERLEIPPYGIYVAAVEKKAA